MKLIVFGATGSVGKLLVEQAMAQGHEVTAFARNPERLGPSRPGLRTYAGDVLNPDDVGRALPGHDAAFVIIGAGRKGGVRREGTRNIVDAMKLGGVRRLICQSTLGAGDSRPALNFFWKRIMFGILLKDAYRDHQEQEGVVRRSGLAWTIVRPGAFTDGLATGAYRHGFPPDTDGLQLKISRSDVAEFLLRQLTDRTYLHRTPGLSY